MSTVGFNHVGHCVADLERSTRFYEALGFVVDHELEPPDKLTAPLLRLAEPVGLTARYLKLGEVTLELLHYAAGTVAAPAARVMDEQGLTHLSFTVEDVPAVLEQVRALGGTVLEDTDIGLAVMIRDPDGQLLELLPARS